MAKSTTETAAPKKAPRAKKPAAEAVAAEAVAAAEAAAATPDVEPAKAKFAQAIEEARAGAEALGKQAQERAEQYRDKLAGVSSEWIDEAKALSGQAKERAAELAVEGKAKASDAISNLGKIVADTAPQLDEKLGPKYGDVARTAARSMQETAARIESKDITELGNDAKEFVRKSPGLAVGIAAVAGFFVARLFKGSGSQE